MRDYNGVSVYDVNEAAHYIGLEYYHLLYNERVGKFPLPRRDTSRRRIYTKQDLKELKALCDGKASYDKATDTLTMS
jgi:DNA-binding transcriptional MerR regulator